MLLRYWFLFRRSSDRMSDVFYWPTIDLLIWGLTGKYLQTASGNANIVLLIISGILFWLVVWRGNYEVSVNFLEELWNKNLVNIFVSPLQLKEWIASVLIIGIVKMILSLGYASILAFFLYKTNVLSYGWYLIPFSASLMFTGWAMGLLVSGIIFRFGTRVQNFAWSAIAVISPFSAIYYPIKTLPEWAQSVAKFIPTSYIFESGRELISKGKIPENYLLISFGLNLFYITLATIFLYSSFNKAKHKGLINVY